MKSRLLKIVLICAACLLAILAGLYFMCQGVEWASTRKIQSKRFYAKEYISAGTKIEPAMVGFTLSEERLLERLEAGAPDYSVRDVDEIVGRFAGVDIQNGSTVSVLDIHGYYLCGLSPIFLEDDELQRGLTRIINLYDSIKPGVEYESSYGKNYPKIKVVAACPGSFGEFIVKGLPPVTADKEKPIEVTSSDLKNQYRAINGEGGTYYIPTGRGVFQAVFQETSNSGSKDKIALQRVDELQVGTWTTFSDPRQDPNGRFEGAFPDIAKAREALALSLEYSGKLTEAEKLYLQILASVFAEQPDAKQWELLMNVRLLDNMMKQNRPDEAKKYFDRAVKLVDQGTDTLSYPFDHPKVETKIWKARYAKFVKSSGKMPG